MRCGPTEAAGGKPQELRRRGPTSADGIQHVYHGRRPAVVECGRGTGKCQCLAAAGTGSQSIAPADYDVPGARRRECGPEDSLNSAAGHRRLGTARDIMATSIPIHAGGRYAVWTSIGPAGAGDGRGRRCFESGRRLQPGGAMPSGPASMAANPPLVAVGAPMMTAGPAANDLRRARANTAAEGGARDNCHGTFRPPKPRPSRCSRVKPKPRGRPMSKNKCSCGCCT